MSSNNSHILETRHKILTAHFLKRLRNEFKENQCLASLSLALIHLLREDELRSIIHRKYGEMSDKRFGNLKEKSPQELIMIIEDEYYILDFLLDEIWKDYRFD